MAGPNGRPAHRVVRTPPVLQMEITECGAAALAAVLGYYGRDIPLEELREACAVTRDGVNARNMLLAARGYGLEGEGIRDNLKGLRRLDPPFIAFWDQNHFLTVEGFGRRKVHLNDPAAGRYSMSYEDFERHYSGIVLRLHKGPEFKPDARRSRRKPLVELVRSQSSVWSAVAYSVIAGMASVVPRTAAAILTGIFVEQILVAHNQDWETKVLLIAGIIVVLQFFLTLFQQRVLLRLQMKLSIRMSAGFLWHLLRLPTRFFDARSPGGLVSRIQLNSQVAQLLSGQLAMSAISVVTMVLFGIVMLLVNWQLALVVIALALLNGIVLIVVSRARTAVNQNLQQTLVRLSGATYLAINMIDDIKATGAEDEVFARWTGTQAQVVNADQRLGRLTYMLLVVPGFLGMVNTIVILAVGGLFVIDGDLSLASLVTFQLLAGYFFSPIGQLVTTASLFQNARAWIQQIDDVMAQQTVDDQEKRALPREARAAQEDHHRLEGHLELRDLTFGYTPNQPPLVRNLSLTVAPGERVALVGPTGSGKSTVANLVTGLLEPWSGEVLFDGRRRDEIAPEVMSASLAKVDQSVLLFSGTVADNIRFWDDSIPAASVVRAARDASITPEIDAKPGGFAYLVTEGGRNFSGGQRQRLEIARALSTNPSVLILDEATSALDTVNEEEIDTGLRRRGCTCLLIAHRLSTIRDCDQILVLDEGEVVQRGTHEELLEQGGLYAELVGNE